jgi:hypothetical protein
MAAWSKSKILYFVRHSKTIRPPAMRLKGHRSSSIEAQKPDEPATIDSWQYFPLLPLLAAAFANASLARPVSFFFAQW